MTVPPNGPELWSAILRTMPPGSILAGGAVRDFFLGVEPKDFDVFVCPSLSVFIPDGFCSLPDSERREEYEAQPQIDFVVRGEFAPGITVDLIGTTVTPWSPENLVQHFDFGVTRCWFDGSQIGDTPEAKADRLARTVTRLIHSRPERAQARFDRFNEKMGGSWTYDASLGDLPA